MTAHIVCHGFGRALRATELATGLIHIPTEYRAGLRICGEYFIARLRDLSNDPAVVPLPPVRRVGLCVLCCLIDAAKDSEGGAID